MKYAYLVLIFLLATQPRVSGSDTGAVPAPVMILPESGESVEIAYDFSEHLDSAAAWIVLSQKETEDGVWEGDKFVFTTASARAEIQTVSQMTVNGEIKAIRFNPLQSRVRKVQFRGVTSGSQMVFSYGIDVEGDPQKVISYINLGIFIGKHRIKLLRIPIIEGWKTEYIPLKMLSFWDRDVTVIFEISTDSGERVFFNFHSVILP